MSFAAKAYRILIGSPGDLSEERPVATEAIREWNDEFAEREKAVLLPVKWETHAVPQVGYSAQEVINEQLVKKCDMLVAFFWTRMGTKTVKGEGGTAEEIDLFVSAKKPVLLYFSSRPIDPNKMDIRQYKRLNSFKKEMEQRALIGNFSNLEELRQKLKIDLFRQVQILESDKSAAIEEKTPMPEPTRHAEEQTEEDELEGNGSHAPSDLELLELSTQRSNRRLLDILRKVCTRWKEQPVPSNGGSFRYWSQMADGGRRVICGFNVAGKRFNSNPGILDVWICHGPATELGGYTDKQELFRYFKEFKILKTGKSRFWIALSNFAEAEKLYNIFSGWISKTIVQ